MFSGQQTQILKALDKGWVTALAAGTIHSKQVGFVFCFSSRHESILVLRKRAKLLPLWGLLYVCTPCLADAHAMQQRQVGTSCPDMMRKYVCVTSFSFVRVDTIDFELKVCNPDAQSLRQLCDVDLSCRRLSSAQMTLKY